MSAAIHPPFPFRRPSLLTIIKRDSCATPVDTTPGSKRMCFSQTGCHSPNIGGMNEHIHNTPTRHKPDLYNTAIDLRRPFMKRKPGPSGRKLNVPPEPSIPEPKQGRRRQTRELIGERLRHTLNPVQRGHSAATGTLLSAEASKPSAAQHNSRSAAETPFPQEPPCSRFAGGNSFLKNKIQVASLFRPRAERAKALRRLPKTRADTLRRCPLAVRIAIAGD